MGEIGSIWRWHNMEVIWPPFELYDLGDGQSIRVTSNSAATVESSGESGSKGSLSLPCCLSACLARLLMQDIKIGETICAREAVNPLPTIKARMERQSVDILSCAPTPQCT